MCIPLYRQRRIVSVVAEALSSKDGEHVNRFLRQTARNLLRQLVASGVAVETAEEEVRMLLYVVLGEMQRNSVGGRK
ncbi:DUF6074 family protein [Mesorhizobium sp.]|uniref:DUF6074 family protein n=1 Tax=Mesorhizobium sp. TaxID=1871066 RepID=UPI00338F9909